MTLQEPIKHLPLDDLKSKLSGYIITPDSKQYDNARAVWNGMIDHRPALIVRCHEISDVVATVNFARTHQLRLSVRGGGHNVAGNAVVNDAIVVDLSEMTNVEVDARNKLVHAQGGTTLADLDKATQAFNLAVPSGLMSETGIAGLTLGGGFGWLRNKYGLMCDNLVGAEVVTANGQVLTVSEHEHGDLMWALRGGGGQFGVVTRFTYKAHPVGPQIAFTFVMHPGENAKQALAYFRETAKGFGDDVSAIAVLGHVPPVAPFPEESHERPFVLFAAAYAGDPEEGEKILAPLRDYDTPIVDFSDIMPYVEMQKIWDEDYPSGELHYYWKSSYLDSLSDEAIEILVAQNAKSPSVLSTVDIWHLGGAFKRFDNRTSAFGARESNFLLGIEANWEKSDDDDSNIAWARDVIEAIQPLAGQRRYINFPGFHEDDALMEAMFGDNATTVKSIKAKYDPSNMFRLK